MWKVLHSRWTVVLWVECSVLQWTVCGRYCTICNRTVLTVIAHKLLLHVQLHNSTAHLLYTYFTNCRVCNGTVLTVITQKLLLLVHLHNCTSHLLNKFCTNSTVCNWTVLTVFTHKLPLHVQLHNSTAHLLYKFCTKLYSLQLKCTYSNYTEAAASCSTAQQQRTFTVQILYKLYRLQLNCTYSNYTEAAVTC